MKTTVFLTYFDNQYQAVLCYELYELTCQIRFI